MGNSASATPAEVEQATLDKLSESGRYIVLRARNGQLVHVLGVIPASPHSAREAAALLEAIAPKAIYVDSDACDQPRIVAEALAGSSWRPDELPPSFSFQWARGMVFSVEDHKVTCARQLFRMVGLDRENVWRLAASVANATGADLVSFPRRMDRKFNDFNLAHMRVGRIAFDPAGNAAFWSDSIQFLVSIEMTSYSIIDHTLSMPKSGYFTTVQLAALRDDLTKRIDAFTRANTITTCDFAPIVTEQIELLTQRAEGTLQPDVVPHNPGLFKSISAMEVAEAKQVIPHMMSVSDLHDGQARITAAALQEASARTGGDVVALVELPRVAHVVRVFDSEFRTVDQVLPERSWPVWAAFTGLPLAVGSLGIYGTYRLARRFPRAALYIGSPLVVTATVATTLSIAAAGYSQFGTTVWRALARPVEPVGSVAPRLRSRANPR